MPGEVAVSVLLCTYNDMRYLPHAIDSVLRQTFTDFELICIDDGSTDTTGDYLGCLRDPRLRVYSNPKNLGLTASLNIGLTHCRGRYIARMDADDVCEPQRLQWQVEHLDAHPDVGILGSSRLLIDESGVAIKVATAAQGDLAIRWKCLLGNPFAHPTVMLRKAVLDEHAMAYADTYRTAQDYELWARLLPLTRGENLPEPLLRYRLRPGISRLSRQEQLENHDQIAHTACSRLVPNFPLTLEDVRQLRGRYGGFSVREPSWDPHDPHWQQSYLRLLEAFAEAHKARPGIEEFVAARRTAIESETSAASAPALTLGAPARDAPLDYRDGREDLRDVDSAQKIAIRAGALMAITVFGCVAAWMLILIAPARASTSPIDWILPGAITCAAIIGWAITLYHRSTPYILGALIGLGTALLLEGVCFGKLR